MDESKVLSDWEELKGLVQSLELDVHKNAKGTAAAGVRVRKGLRSLKRLASGLVKLTISTDKQRKTEKPKKEKKEKKA